jgi:ribosome-associated protein
MDTLGLRGDFITLARAVKAVGLAETGGQAKMLIRGETVAVNGLIEIQPGKKLRAGDRFGLVGEKTWTVTGENRSNSPTSP